MKAITVGAREMRTAVSMADAIDAVRSAFVDFTHDAFEMPVRTSMRQGQFLVMSAHHRPSGTAAIKTLSLNFDDRNPAIVGTVLWSDVRRTEHVIADAATLTSLRTGAITGVATDLLASRDASTCVIFGAGGQAADQIRAVHTVRPLTELRIVDTREEQARELADLLGPELTDTKIDCVSEAAAAVRDMDLVCCATTSRQPLFSTDWLRDQVHVNAIGAFRPSMREVPDELLGSATVVIDEKEAILQESGEIIHAIDSGALAHDSLVELGAALVNGVDRQSRTVFKSVGVAVQDWAIARLLAERFLN